MSISKRIRHNCLVLFLALLAVALPFVIGIAPSAQSSPSNASIAVAINSTASYINTVNQSSYLVFYPNLTSAYKYLGLARNESQSNSTYAFLLLNKAMESAQHQQQMMLQYQDLSLLILVVLSVFLAAVLYFFMRPRGSKPKVRHLSK